MQSFGDREELLVTLQHQPSSVHARATPVGQQRLQHLGDTATLRGGIDVPHDAPGEQRTRLFGDGAQMLDAVGGQRPREQAQRHALDLHLLESLDTGWQQMRKSRLFGQRQPGAHGNCPCWIILASVSNRHQIGPPLCTELPFQKGAAVRRHALMEVRSL